MAHLESPQRRSAHRAFKRTTAQALAGGTLAAVVVSVAGLGMQSVTAPSTIAVPAFLVAVIGAPIAGLLSYIAIRRSGLPDEYLAASVETLLADEREED